jgi:hypothetical protein
MHVLHLGKKLKTLSVILILVLGIGIFSGMRKESSSEPRIEYFEVQNGTFISETKNISRAEVWMVPTESTKESDWKTLGLMQRSSHWFATALWKLPVPEKPVAAMQIMIRGYDSAGIEADRVSLPWIGEKTLEREIWKK